jgi:hypothetical protein
MLSSGVLRRMDLVRTNISEERIASIIRMTSIGEAGTTLGVTSKVVPTSLILVTLMMEAIIFYEKSVLQEPHGVASQKTTFFIVTALKT